MLVTDVGDQMLWQYYCLWTFGTHITSMCFQLFNPYIFCTLYSQYNSHPHLIYISYNVLVTSFGCW